MVRALSLREKDKTVKTRTCIGADLIDSLRPAIPVLDVRVQVPPFVPALVLVRPLYGAH